MNKVFLIGRLTRDPELRYTSNNIASASFSIAINRPFENQNGVREADFINIVVWRKQAENIKKYISKGSLVAVDGRIQTRNYEDKDGKKVYVTEVVGDSVQFLETKQQQSRQSNETYESAPPEKGDEPYVDFGQTIELSDDDIAF